LEDFFEEDLRLLLLLERLDLLRRDRELRKDPLFFSFIGLETDIPNSPISLLTAFQS
jgi:hypothetical protein